MYNIRTSSIPLDHGRIEFFHNHQAQSELNSEQAQHAIAARDWPTAFQKLGRHLIHAIHQRRKAYSRDTARSSALAYQSALTLYRDFVHQHPEHVVHRHPSSDPLNDFWQQIVRILNVRDRTAIWLDNVPVFNYKGLLNRGSGPDRYNAAVHDQAYLHDLAVQCSERGRRHGLGNAASEIDCQNDEACYYALHRLLDYIDGADYDRTVRGINPNLIADLTEDYRQFCATPLASAA